MFFYKEYPYCCISNESNFPLHLILSEITYLFLNLLYHVILHC